jgi:putative ABC transport system permease protein
MRYLAKMMVAWLGDTQRDFRFALRQLVRRGSRTVIAIATLAIGIGVVMAVFSAAFTVLRPPHYKDGTRLVSVWLKYLKARNIYFGPSGPPARRVVSAGRLDAAASYRLTQAVWGVSGARFQLNTAYVSRGFFRLLGTTPALGRFPVPAEYSGESTGVVVIGQGVWRQLFGSNPHVLGKTLRFEGRLYVVIGVAPPGFDFPTVLSPSSATAKTQMWLPWTANANPPSGFWGTTGMIACLPRGMRPEQVAARLNSIGATLVGPEEWDSGSTLKFLVVPLETELVGAARPTLHLLLLAAAVLYFVAMLNVTGLFSAHSWYRRGEMATRLALGAPPARLVRGLVVESCTLAVAAGAFGLVLGLWLLAALRFAAPHGLLASAHVDAAAVAVCVGLALAASVAADLPSILAVLHVDPADTMRGAQPGRTSQRRSFGRFLVAAETAGTVMLLATCIALVHSFRALAQVPIGMRTHGVLTLSLVASTAKYDTRAKQQELLSRLLHAASAVPEVSSTAISGAPLLSSMYFIPANLSTGGRTVVSDEARSVTPGFFKTLGIPVVYGRGFNSGDKYNGPPVAVVNELFARQAWSASNPIGQRIGVMEKGKVVRSFTIVGVVGNARDNRLQSPPVPEFYLPLQQNLPYALSITLVLRASGSLPWLERHVQSRIWDVLPNTPISFFHPLSWSIANAEATPGFLARLMSALGVISIVLAILGVYSVFSYSVALRTREIGLRMALGATPNNIATLVLGESARLLAVGIALGIPGAIATSRLLRGLLFSVSATSWFILVIASAVVAATVLATCYLPARSAAHVDPRDALHDA